MVKINRNRQVTEASLGYVVRFVSVTTIFILGLLAAIGTSPTLGQTLSSTVTRARPPALIPWVDGYNLAFVASPDTRTDTRTWIILRSNENNQWPQSVITNLLPLNIDIDGVELARDVYGRSSLLGVLRNNIIYFHTGIGTDFERSTNYFLNNASVPAIVFVGESRSGMFIGRSCWAVAVRYTDKKMVVRPLLIKPGHEFDGFENPAVDLDNNAIGDPSAAYHDGRLVIAWADTDPSHKFQTFSATVVHNPTTDGFDLINRVRGELPSGPSNYVPDNAARPALTHDGAGLFYAAVLKQSGYTGLRHDVVQIYSSSDGANWMRITAPSDAFINGQSQVSIAALPNGDILLAITTLAAGGNEVGRIYQRLNDGSWTELDSAFVFGVTSNPATSIPFSLIRNRYMRF